MWTLLISLFWSSCRAVWDLPVQSQGEVEELQWNQLGQRQRERYDTAPVRPLTSLNVQVQITCWILFSSRVFSGRRGVSGWQRVQSGPHQTGHFQNLPIALHFPEGNRFNFQIFLFFMASSSSLLDESARHTSSSLPPPLLSLQGGPYHDLLHSVLGAYTCYRPDIGYVSLLFSSMIKKNKLRTSQIWIRTERMNHPTIPNVALAVLEVVSVL